MNNKNVIVRATTQELRCKLCTQKGTFTSSDTAFYWFKSHLRNYHRMARDSPIVEALDCRTLEQSTLCKNVYERVWGKLE